MTQPRAAAFTGDLAVEAFEAGALSVADLRAAASRARHLQVLVSCAQDGTAEEYDGAAAGGRVGALVPVGAGGRPALACAQVWAGGQAGAGAEAGVRVGAGEQPVPALHSAHSRPLRISTHSVMTIVR
jgi:hypothetical protein